ncbi:hypothetical protein HY501_02165 [Candidatus Woesearchaeota archaeon]|nr:hypothetical protein [Candidatus Woesearchaeota archaeon]
MQKRGQVWISVVMYMALGVVALTLILSAGVPLIQKLKDKNTVTQTKNLFLTIDENIRAVVNEGPGAKRFLSPFEIRTGEFYVDSSTSRILWNMTTTAKMLEPDVPLNEGAVQLLMYETNIIGEYIMTMQLPYANIATISLASDFSNPFKGTYSFGIRHSGTYDAGNKPIIMIEIQ